MERFFSCYRKKLSFAKKYSGTTFLRKYLFQRVPNRVEKLQKFLVWGSKAKCPPWGGGGGVGGGVWIFFGTTQLVCHAWWFSSFTLVNRGADGRLTVTWLPKFLGWVDYLIFLGMELRSPRKARPWSSTKTSSTRECPYYLLQLTSSHLLLVNVPLFPLSLASAQVIKEKKNII